MNTRKSRALWSGLVAAMLAGTAAHAQTNTLVTGKRITLPPLGIPQNVGSLPTNMATTPDDQYALVVDSGHRPALNLSVIRTTDGTLVASVPFARRPVGTTSTGRSVTDNNGLYYGVAISPVPNADRSYTAYVAQGGQSSIVVCTISPTGGLTTQGTIPMQTGDFPAGLALSPDGQTLYVANNQFYNGGTLAEITTPGTLVVYNTQGANVVQPFGSTPISVPAGGTKTVPAAGATPAPEVARLPLGPNFGTPAAPFTPPSFPLAVAATATEVYVTSQRDGVVYAISTTDFSKVKTTIPTGAHPAGLALNKAGSALYVANAHSETVSVINTASDTVSSTIDLHPAGAKNLPGATPVGLTLSPDEKTLYVALGDMNALGVVSLATGRVTGYIPTGWYPTAVVNAPYRHLLVANAKGTVTRNPNPDYTQYLPLTSPTSGKTYAPTNNNHYTLDIIEGQVSLLSVPTAAQLVQDTQQVLANNRLPEIGANPLPAQALAGIKHIFYIVKENRTYDQVLGDLPQGNGDPSLVLFGQQITPNFHALARNYVLLDNFYDCAEASGDGWPWSTQGQANEYVIKNLPYNYGGRGRNYDFEGQNNNYPVGGVPTTDAYGQPLVSAGSPFAGAPAIPDVGEAPGGHIWDLVKNKGLSYRNYGFYMVYNFAKFAYAPDGNGSFTSTVTPGVLPENYPNSVGLRPAGHDMAGISDVDFRAYDNDYPDSDAPFDYYKKTGKASFLYPKPVFGHYNQPSRFSEFKREFGEYQGADPTLANYPAFTMVRFNHDHTQGLSSGTHSPQAEVADNDYGVGQLVDLISHSPIWQSSAIFVVEDDAQAGPDHVDCHRSTAFVISPWIKKGSVDHTFYNTDSLLHTMELLLGLNPMSQYDAVATPILDFDSTVRTDTYSATEPDASVIGDLNPSLFVLKPGDPRYQLVAMSNAMDFLHPDSAPAQLLNDILWKSVKGVHSAMPSPRHTLTEAQLHFGLHAAKGKAASKGIKPVAHDDDH